MSQHIRFYLCYEGDQHKASRAEQDMRNHGQLNCHYATGSAYYVSGPTIADARAGDDPPWMVPYMLAEAMKKRHMDYHMDKGVSVAVEIKPMVLMPNATWAPAPTPDTIHEPQYKVFAEAQVLGAETKDARENEKEEQEEEEEEEEYKGIVCPNCGARDEDTTFHALMMVTETRSRTVHESREVRAWVEVRSVDEEGNAKVYGCIEEVYDDDDDEVYEEYDDDVFDSETEIGSSEGILYCTECEQEFDAPGDVG